MDPPGAPVGSSVQPQHQSVAQHLLLTSAGRRPSRFKPVRFQEYRMQWGGTRVASVAVSVSDVYVLDPDCPALAAAAAATSLDDASIANPTLSKKFRLPSDVELVASAEAEAAAAATNCGCRRRRGVGNLRHQRRLSANNLADLDGCCEPGDNCGVGRVVWTLQQSGCTHETRCPRRSAARAYVTTATSISQQQQQQQHRRPHQLHLHSCLEKPVPALLRPALTRQASALEDKRPASIDPPPTSPSEAELQVKQSDQPAPSNQQTSSSKPPESHLPASATFKRPTSPQVRTEVTATITAATSPTTFDDMLAAGVGSAESCAESCVATVAQVLQDALLAAVRAETEPLERQLAEKDAELKRLRQELRDRDARLRRLNRLLTCRRLLMLDAVQQQLHGNRGDGNGDPGSSSRRHGYASNNGTAASSALSSLL